MKSEVPTIVKFEQAGLDKPDMRMRFFNTMDFHVHSTILRLHSRYFRNYLDSADRKPAGPDAPFSYELEARMKNEKPGYMNDNWNDTTMHWTLVECDVKTGPTRNARSWRWFERHAALFRMLLCALYSQPFSLNTLPSGMSETEELEFLIQLGDDYQCMPMLSLALNGAINATADLHKIVACEYESSVELLLLAIKVRNPLLYRHSLMVALNPWDSPSIDAVTDVKTLEDPRVRQCIKNARASVDRKLALAQQSLLNAQQSKHMRRMMDQVIEKLYHDQKKIRGRESIPLARFYRLIYDRLESENRMSLGLAYRLEDLLANNLPRRTTNRESVGRGILTNSFLCADIPDEDLPWDVNERDW
ncbi:hypothetical protein PVAG01_02076 [Phlyctema vagabunda]|uniref:BTB domain-containing protein n=1 Tax=Phlyctema vagabunda TaxID=108571 RepID=A0ABR4PPS7_9HELO